MHTLISRRVTGAELDIHDITDEIMPRGACDSTKFYGEYVDEVYITAQ